MESTEIIVDGKKIEIVTKLPDELKDDYVLIENLEDTLDLEEITSFTQEVEINNE